MPKFLEEALEKSAEKKGFTGRRKAAYVYGGMNDIGAMHGNKETAKGARMEKKHESDVRQGKAEGQRKHKKVQNPRSHHMKLKHG